ncbi:hypothetical protein ACSBO6_19825 [Bacillus sp. AL-1R]
MNSNIYIPGLKDCLVTKVEEYSEKICLFVEMKIAPHSCPSCKNKTNKAHDY